MIENLYFINNGNCYQIRDKNTQCVISSVSTEKRLFDTFFELLRRYKAYVTLADGLNTTNYKSKPPEQLRISREEQMAEALESPLHLEMIKAIKEKIYGTSKAGKREVPAKKIIPPKREEPKVEVKKKKVLPRRKAR